jgi:hypothetical protein
MRRSRQKVAKAVPGSHSWREELPELAGKRDKETQTFYTKIHWVRHGEQAPETGESVDGSIGNRLWNGRSQPVIIGFVLTYGDERGGGIMSLSFDPEQSNLTSGVALCHPEASTCIDAVIALSRENLLDQAIDLIFESFNDWQSHDRFGLCDEAIQYLLLNVGEIEPTLLVSFLVITLAAKPKLPSRAMLYATAESIYLERFGEDRTKKLLVGLK